MYTAIAALFGAIIGSFLNVVITRYRTGRGLSGRSACATCARTLAWYELVPVFSFIVLRGHCRSCRARISWQYPLVELAGALLFAVLWWQCTPVYTAFDAVRCVIFALAGALSIVIFVYDIRHTIIPDALVYSLGALAFVSTFFSAGGVQFPTIALLVAGPVLAAPFALLWLISSGRWIGLGDAKLAVVIGWFFGLPEGASVVILAVWIGAIVGLSLVALTAVRTHLRRLAHTDFKRTMKSEIPFAPFLLASAAIHALSGFSAFRLFDPLFLI